MAKRRSESTAGEPHAPECREWLVDGYNVLHVALLPGRRKAPWWTRPYRAEVLGHVARFDDPSAVIHVVFDGSNPPGQPELEVPGRSDDGPRVEVVFAPDADEWLARRVRADESPGELVVVTADRRVAARVRHAGARVLSRGKFIARCPAVSDQDALPEPPNPEA